MTDLLPGRVERSDVEVRLRLLAIAGVLAFVILAVSYLLLPTELAGMPAVAFWALPVLFAALAVSLFSGQYILESLRFLRQEVVRWRELARTREEERDLAQDEIVRRLQKERDLGREKVQFEAQLAAYEKYAALAQLALGAAHEINNPLLGISSHLELELKHTTDPEQREEIDQCIAGTRRISSTIRGLINYARPGPLVLGKIQIGRLVEETLTFLRHQPLFRRLRLEMHIAPELPPIRSEANQLSQILMNLLLNAAQATPEGGAITISAQKVKFVDALELTVTDTGVGIPADILPHVFEPFFTTKRGRSEEHT